MRDIIRCSIQEVRRIASASNLAIEQPNHVCCAEVNYKPLRRGVLSQVKIMDWATRKLVAWRLPIPLRPHLAPRGEGSLVPFGRRDRKSGSRYEIGLGAPMLEFLD